jgi:hypothetical protein
MRYPLYNVIMFDKINLIKQAKELNPFQSDYFYWTDAGAFRDEIEKYQNKQWPDGKYSKKVNIELYTSGDSGSYIRNAVTGQKYKYKVGSKNEDLLFKTKVCIEGLHYSNSLFYDSPEQFEKHFFVTVNGETKETWYSKNLDARRE